MKKLIMRILIILFISVLIIGLTGIIIRKPDNIIKQTSEYIYVKKYSLYNLDSTIYRYNTDKIYDGVIINKRRSSEYVGIRGKGGHPVTKYYVTIMFNDTIHEYQDYNLYHKYNKGNRVKVKESWYPRHNIQIY